MPVFSPNYRATPKQIHNSYVKLTVGVEPKKCYIAASQPKSKVDSKDGPQADNDFPAAAANRSKKKSRNRPDVRKIVAENTGGLPTGQCHFILGKVVRLSLRNIGESKNNGVKWEAEGKRKEVDFHDFGTKTTLKETPFGIDDVGRNEGLVEVGTSLNSAAYFRNAMRSIRCVDGGRSSGKENIRTPNAC